MPTVQRCDVEKGPDEEETTHRQGPHDEQLEPRAAEPDKGSGGGAAVSSRAGYVGTRRTIQCTSRAAPIQPPVIQRVVRAVERVRRETTARPTSGRGCGRQPIHASARITQASYPMPVFSSRLAVSPVGPGS